MTGGDGRRRLAASRQQPDFYGDVVKLPAAKSSHLRSFDRVVAQEYVPASGAKLRIAAATDRTGHLRQGNGYAAWRPYGIRPIINGSLGRDPALNTVGIGSVSADDQTLDGGLGPLIQRLPYTPDGISQASGSRRSAALSYRLPL